MCFFEMLDANALVRNHPQSARILKTGNSDRGKIAGQILGRDPGMMLEAAGELQKYAKISFLDINAACPAKKVIKKKAGAYLLEDAGTLQKITKNLTRNLKIPVTIKLRTGFDKKDVPNIQRVARMCEDTGISAIFIHGRTRASGYSGDIDYESIRAVKETVKLPVFGSGNIFGALSAGRMLDETGCDGVLVARGAMGNPWIFDEIKKFLRTGRMREKPAPAEKKRELKRHLGYIQKYKELRHSDKSGFMGKVAMWYLKGFPRAKRLRGEIGKIKTYKDLMELVNSISA